MITKKQIKRILRLAKKTGLTFEEAVRGLEYLSNDPPEKIRIELNKALDDIRTQQIDTQIR